MSDTTAIPTDRESAIALLRQFDNRLDARPAYAECARAMPLRSLLENMRGMVPDETLDAYLAAVDTHNLTWREVHPDAHTIAAEMIAGAMGGTR